MITEEVLTELLGATAEEVPVPDGAAARAIAQLRTASGAARDRGAWWKRPAVVQFAQVAAVVAVVAGGITGLVVAASGSRQESSSSKGAVASAPSAAASAPERGVAKGATGEPIAPLATDSSRRVVKNATVDLQVATGKVAATLERLRALPTAYGGFVGASDSNLSGGSPNGTLTLRVPVGAYGAVRDALTHGSYGKPLDVTESGEDVTAQYTDLAARIAALQISRQTYLTMLSKTGSIGDVLAVQQRLDAVQQQIEQLQGEQKVLADQSDDATIKVTVSESGAASVVPAPGRTGFSKAWHDSWRGFTGGAQWLLAISGGLLITLIVLAVLGLIARQATRRLRRYLV